jgi:hypothetical protein
VGAALLTPPQGQDRQIVRGLAARLKGAHVPHDPVQHRGQVVRRLRRGRDGGDAVTIDGIASTRRGNAESWRALCGADGPSPSGKWVLGLNPAAVRLIAQGVVDDVLFVVSWSGQAARWPE